MYNEQVRRGQVSEKAKFEYAWCLVRSKYIDDMKEGVALLEGTEKQVPYSSVQYSTHTIHCRSLMYLLRPVSLFKEHRPQTILFHFYLSFNFLLYGKIWIDMLQSYSSSHTKDLLIYGAQKLQITKSPFCFHGCYCFTKILINFIYMSKENPSCGDNFERYLFSHDYQQYMYPMNDWQFLYVANNKFEKFNGHLIFCRFIQESIR